MDEVVIRTTVLFGAYDNRPLHRRMGRAIIGERSRLVKSYRLLLILSKQFRVKNIIIGSSGMLHFIPIDELHNVSSFDFQLSGGECEVDNLHDICGWFAVGSGRAGRRLRLRLCSLRFGDCRFSDCRFGDCRFSDFRFSDCRFGDCRFSDFRFSNFRLSNFRFSDCRC